MHWRTRITLMQLRGRALANRLHESLLFVPALMVATAAAGAALLARLDRQLPPDALPPSLQLPPEAAVELLSTIAGATITTAGVVFSLMLISMQLASGQFSPRVLRGFYRDRLSKLVVGLMAAVFTWCVVTLQSIPVSTDGRPLDVPDLAADTAVLLALVAIFVLLAFLSRISHRQYVGHIIAAIANESVARLHEVHGVESHCVPPAEAPDVTRLGTPFVVTAPRDGWVQQVSGTAVLAAAPPGSVVRLETRVGAFLARGIPLASVWPIPRCPRKVERAIARVVVVGETRTMQQDLDFGLRQLSDIALRALSPAVNDPTTAIECVLRIASLLRRLLLTELPGHLRRSENGSVLLWPWDLDHAEYVRHGFGQLRVYAAQHPQVAIAIVRSLRMLREAEVQSDREDALREIDQQLALTLEGCERAGLLEADLAEVRRAAAFPQDPRMRVRGQGAPLQH